MWRLSAVAEGYIEELKNQKVTSQNGLEVTLSNKTNIADNMWVLIPNGFKTHIKSSE